MNALTGHVESGTHRLPIRVYYEDTDTAGIVYYAMIPKVLSNDP